MASIGPVQGQPTTSVGLGGYANEPPPGVLRPQEAVYRTDRVRGPMPTNDWWSSLAWLPLSERQYAHPLAFRAEKVGMRIFAPGARIFVNKVGIQGGMPDGPDDIVLGHSGRAAFAEARVDGFSDWFVSARFGPVGRGMTITYGHGSPFVFARFEGGTARLTLPEVPGVWSGDASSPILGLSVRGQPYALFGPTGSSWDGLGTKVLTNKTDRGYFSLALLPDASDRSLRAFRPYAHSHVTDSRVDWNYEPKEGRIVTRFRVTTEALEGTTRGTMFALYPHQWQHAPYVVGESHFGSVRGGVFAYPIPPPDAAPLGMAYQSVRGGMKLLEAKHSRRAIPSRACSLACPGPSEPTDSGWTG